MRVTVIGQGYLGVTHAVCLSVLGHDVLGVDVNADTIGRLAAYELPFYEPGLAELLREQSLSGRLRFTTSYREAAEFGELHFLCVGTPQRADGPGADLRYVDAAVAELAPLLTRACVLVGKSTVPVGTSARLADQIHRSAPAGREVEVAWNPEFLREGHAVDDTLRPERLVVGVRPGRAEGVLRQVYASLIDDGVPFITTDPATAELAKSAANAFLATKISFVNAMAEVCAATGADVTELAAVLALDTRIGGGALAPGLGYGGGCLGKDLRALVARADEIGAGDAVGFLREVDAVNDRRRSGVVELARQLCGGSFRHRRVAVWGAAFKPGSDDIRDSPALAVADAIVAAGGEVAVYDPKALDNIRVTYPMLKCAASAQEAVEDADVLLHLTEWTEFGDIDPAVLKPARRQVVDGRFRLDPTRWSQAQWTYHSPGRPTVEPIPRCVQLGFGSVAAVHLRKWTDLGVEIDAVVDKAPARHEVIRAHGLRPVTSIADVGADESRLWDVCVPTADHAEVVKSIVDLDPAANILVEKPICAPGDVAALTETLRGHTGRLAVNENYASSRLITEVRAALSRFGVVPHTVRVEMTKDRRADIAAGRFVDSELGVVGYEGPHLVTLAEGVLDEPVTSWRLRAGAVNDLAAGHGTPMLPRQGSAWVRATAASGCDITLLTAMDGTPLTATTWTEMPYRVVIVDGTSAEHGETQVLARQTTSKDGVPLVTLHVSSASGLGHESVAEDDSMREHLRRVLDFFRSGAGNPYPFERAVRCLDFLSSWAALPGGDYEDE